MSNLHVIKADFARWFLNKKFYLYFFAIILLNYFIIFQNVEEIKNSTIVNIVFYYMDDPFFIINFMIAAMLMGPSYCDEKESGYYKFWIIRCNEKKYICSKIINCFFSAFFLLTTGMFLWILSLRMIMPWADKTSDQFIIVADQGMGILLQQDRFYIYYILYCLGIGMLAGILSVGTFTISLFMNNRTLVILSAALIFYIDVAYLGNLSPWINCWNLEQILFFPFSRIPSVGITVLRGIVYTMLLLIFFSFVSYWQLKRGEES